MSAYHQWRAYLRGEGTRDYVRGIFPGFWRARYGAGDEFHPLATFELNGQVVGLMFDELFTEEELTEMGVWPKAARHPITESTYRSVAEQGRPWPKQPKAEYVSPV